ncbi:hypothetical protein D3C79_800540 [compost metagenome]
MQNELRLVVADHPAGLQAAKRTPVPKGIHRLKHAGFPAAVGANQEVESRRQRQIRRFYIAEVFNQ